MGGFGSGGHNSKGRSLVEAQYRLDASNLQRRGLTRLGNVSQLSWKDHDGSIGRSIRVIGGNDAITLEYSWRKRDGAWQAHSERVELDRVARNLGGEETYFLCPRCSVRVKRIYGAGVRYLCRTCHALVYASTQERPGNRATRKNQKLRRKLGVEIGLGDWVGPKPKGMHQKTFDRYRARIQIAESEVYDDMLVLLGRMEKHRVNHTAKIRRQFAALPFWR